MQKSKPIIDITLRITGKNLNPTNVSQALSMKPDRQWERGESMALHDNRHSSPKKNGLWAISHKAISIENIAEILESLARSIIDADPPLNELSGWESTSISVNIGSRESEEIVQWTLDPTVMTLLASAKANLVFLTY